MRLTSTLFGAACCPPSAGAAATAPKRISSMLHGRNAAHVSRFDRTQAKPLGLNLSTAIVTCMDSRINVFDMLGVGVGDCHIIRTAGGRVQDAIRSLVISQTQIGLNEVMLIQHTDCAALTFSEQSLRSSLLSLTTQGHLPSTAPFQISSTSFLPFPEAPDPTAEKKEKDEARLRESVKWDVDWLRSNPLFDKRTEVSGWIYEVETGILREVDTGRISTAENAVLSDERAKRAKEASDKWAKYRELGRVSPS